MRSCRFRGIAPRFLMHADGLPAAKTICNIRRKFLAQQSCFLHLGSVIARAISGIMHQINTCDHYHIVNADGPLQTIWPAVQWRLNGDSLAFHQQSRQHSPANPSKSTQ